MRMLMAMAALSLLLPGAAEAQRIDTRRIDIRHLEDGATSCRFAALPALQLGYSATRQNALLGLPAQDSDRANLSIFYKPRAGQPFGVATLSPSIDLAVPAGDPMPYIMHGRLRIDGTGAVFALEGKPTPTVAGSNGALYSFETTDPHALATTLAGGRTAQFELLADSGAVGATYRWDVAMLGGIPELLDAVQWSCTSAGRE